jgi:hypothetical protein
LKKLFHWELQIDKQMEEALRHVVKRSLAELARWGCSLVSQNGAMNMCLDLQQLIS